MKLMLKNGYEIPYTDVEKAFRLQNMDSRYHGVEKSSNHTFEWIFDPSVPFTQWMKQNSSGLFWINGKPGSGKSTLMKFIEDHTKTQQLLLELSLITKRRLIRVHHFLHMRGNLDQRSFVGLLQSVLYQILRSFPKLIQCIVPVLEETNLTGLRNKWTDQDLLGCLRLVLNQSEDDIVIFLLFDALDEFSGDTVFISKFLNKHLLDMAGPRTRVKILFSSRPWDVFLLEFEGLTPLQVQDHNQADIIQYCHNRILAVDEQTRLKFKELIFEIPKKSQGVFVWVKLIMNELIDQAVGLDVRGLWAVLQSTPSDLDDFYTSIIQRIEHKDRLDAYVIFQMALARQDDYHNLINVLTIIYILAIHRCNTYAQSREAFEKVDNDIFPGQDSLGAKVSRFRRLSTSAKVRNFLKGSYFFKPHNPLVRSASWRYVELGIRGKNSNFEVIQRYIRMVSRCCGGLVEMTAGNALDDWPYDYDDDDDDDEGFLNKCGWTVQLLHQTVLDFVKGPKFSHLLLQEMAPSVRDNRFVYLAKLLFTTTCVTLSDYAFITSLGEVCRNAEDSTGHSLHEFINTVPMERFKQVQRPVNNPGEHIRPVYVPGPASFALHADLTLYWKIRPSDLQAACRETSLMILVGRYPNFTGALSAELAKRMDNVRLALQLSTSADRDVPFGHLMYNTCQSTWDPSFHDCPLPPDYRWRYVARAESMAGLFLEFGQNADLPIYGWGMYSGRIIRKRQIDTKGMSWRQRTNFKQHLAKEVWWRPIHLARSCFTEALLDHGADVNGEDMSGNTALDWLAAEFDVEEGATSRGLLGANLLSRFSDDNVVFQREISAWAISEVCSDTLKKIMILIHHGGICKTTGLTVWQRLFEWIRGGQFSEMKYLQHLSPNSPDMLRDSCFDLGEVEAYIASLGLPEHSAPAWP